MEIEWWYDIKRRPEQTGGILISGIEYGFGKPPYNSETTIPDWIKRGDKIDNCYCESRGKYRTRVTKWFQKLGGTFCSSPGNPANFEKRIQSTNWLMRQRKNANKTTNKELGDGAPKFAEAIKEIGPRVLVLMGIRLFDLVIGKGEDSEKTRHAFEGCFGKFEVRKWNDYFISFQPSKPRQFRFGHAKFERLDVIAFPHPSGSHGLRDDQLNSENLRGIFAPILGIQ